MCQNRDAHAPFGSRLSGIKLTLAHPNQIDPKSTYPRYTREQAQDVSADLTYPQIA